MAFSMSMVRIMSSTRLLANTSGNYTLAAERSLLSASSARLLDTMAMCEACVVPATRLVVHLSSIPSPSVRAEAGRRFSRSLETRAWLSTCSAGGGTVSKTLIRRGISAWENDCCVRQGDGGLGRCFHKQHRMGDVTLVMVWLTTLWVYRTQCSSV